MAPDCSRYDRRTFIAGLAGSAAACALPQRVDAQEAGAQRPNVLILQPDQHRGTIMRCAGDAQAITPNLDRLAGEGIRFTHCASTGPVCSPFRGTFQTGLYPHTHGVVVNNIRMSPDLGTFAEVFEKAGYATGYIGKWHLDGGWPPVEGGEGVTPKAVGGFVPPERRQGWHEWQGYEKSHEYFEVWQYNAQAEKTRVKGYDWEPAWQTDVAIDFIQRNRDAGKPWVYYLAYGPPHLPDQCPKKFLDMYDPAKFTLPPDVEAELSPERKAELRRHLQMYYAQVTAVDHEVGRLLKGLKDLGVDENTIVLYTSDHGDILGSHAGKNGRLRGKGRPYATAFRIPFVVRWPRRIRAGQVCDELVSSVDLAETVIDLAGLPIPDEMQGHSKAGWCTEGTGHHSDAIYLGLGNGMPLPAEAVRPSKRRKHKVRMNKVLGKAFPAGPGIGGNPTLRENSGNWDCGYDERLTVKVPPGKHEIMLEQIGKGRMEVEYILTDYVDGQAEFRIPTSDKYNFKQSPESEFAIGSDGTVSNAECLRPHIYPEGSRGSSPIFHLDCKQPATFVVRVTKSVGDASKKLRIYMDDAPKTTAKRKRTGWWRAVWDGHYVYRPGANGWLYDHHADPYEMKNLIDSPEHAEVRKRLDKKLLEFAAQTKDPVLPDLREALG